MQTRREALQTTAAVATAIASVGLLPQAAHAAFDKAAFSAKSVADAVKAMGGNGAMTESADVKIVGPDIAENGAVVPMAVSTTAAGAKKLLLLIEKNPSALVASFNVTADVVPNFATRAKMGQSSDVYAVAIMADGKALFAKKEVKVTLGGCGG
jgi:sulfur-oxidizing protein SoxY